MSPADDGCVGVAVLGSTGSIGRQALDVIDEHSDRFRVVTLAARTASERFFDQSLVTDLKLPRFLNRHLVSGRAPVQLH